MQNNMQTEAKTYDDDEEELKLLSPDHIPKKIAKQEKTDKTDFAGQACIGFCLCLMFILLYIDIVVVGDKEQALAVNVVSMSFTTELTNNSTTQQSHLASARWDLSIQVPEKLVGKKYICLQGYLQASFLYKNVTLATSSLQSYCKLESDRPQVLNISAVATREDLSGAIGREIMEGIKERNQVKFGSRLYFTDCREETRILKMIFECNDAPLRFELESDQIKASLFGNHTTCINTN